MVEKSEKKRGKIRNVVMKRSTYKIHFVGGYTVEFETRDDVLKNIIKTSTIDAHWLGITNVVFRAENVLYVEKLVD